MRGPWHLVLALALLAACPGAVPQRSGVDGPVEIDAPLDLPDAPGTIDAPVVFDARPPDARTIDAPQSCTDSTGTRTGVCIEQSTCTGDVVVNRCPNLPATVRCCLPRIDAGTGLATACDPSAMPAPNAGLTEEPGAGGCPAGMLRIDDASHSYCVDRFEAALELEGGESWSPYFNPGSQKVVARSLRGAVPQGYITGKQAAAACGLAGKRLCSDDEWRRACRGPDGLIYPYGNTLEVGVCNDHRDVHPAVELFGSVTNLSSPCINQLHDSLDPAGARTGCVTAEGAFDMMGNLHEWTADPNGTFRGGFYVDTKLNGPGCTYATTAHDTSYSDYSTGFRCCADL